MGLGMHTISEEHPMIRIVKRKKGIVNASSNIEIMITRPTHRLFFVIVPQSFGFIVSQAGFSNSKALFDINQIDLYP